MNRPEPNVLARPGTARVVRVDDDEFAVVAPPFRLAFRWDGHRWAHEILAGDRRVSGSVEWEPERDDPARVVSPVFQQLSTQEGAGGVRALLVGQWGTHHGSAVFHVSGWGSGAVIDVDVAVRSRGPLLALASTYLVPLSTVGLVEADPATIVWGLDTPPGGRLRFEAAGSTRWPARVGLSEAGGRSVRVQAGTDVVPGATNQRLLYRWRWVGEGEPLDGPAKASEAPARPATSERRENR